MTRSWTRNEVLELARSYQAPAVLAAAIELEVFNLLAAQPLTAEETSAAADADPRGMRDLLDALAALGLLDKEDARYLLPDVIRNTLTDAASDSVLNMARHQANCLQRWTQLAQVVKAGAPAERVPSLRGEEADHRAFILAMHDVSGPVADRVIADLGTVAFTRLLDVGGGSGTWTAAWLKRYPDATAVLFDFEPVIPMARERFRREGMASRTTCVAGDFLENKLPSGIDLAWVSAIVHQHSRDENRRLFGRIAEALVPGGTVLVRDIVMEPSRTQPEAGALFAVNMLVATEGGGTYTFEELADDFAAAGLTEVHMLRDDPGMNAVVSALKPV